MSEEEGIVLLNRERGLSEVCTRMGRGKERDSVLDYVMAVEECERRVEDVVVETEIRVVNTDHLFMGAKVWMEERLEARGGGRREWTGSSTRKRWQWRWRGGKEVYKRRERKSRKWGSERRGGKR